MNCSLLFCIAWAAFPAPGSAFRSEAPGALNDERAAKPPLPDVRLAPLPGDEGEADYLQGISRRAAELAGVAEQADNRTARGEWYLAAANLILAYTLEPACSRTLLGIPAPEDRLAEPSQIKSAMDKARAFLDHAAEDLRKTPEAEAESDERKKTLLRRLESLQALRDGLHAQLLPWDDGETPAFARRAASRLSILLEDTNPRVTAAATLWQAALRLREADWQAALSVLDLPLSDPPKQAVAHGFFARLLRCRVLAEQGGSAAALALLMQLEERCEDWYRDETDRANAVRAVALVQLQVLGSWYDRLSDPGQKAARQWCADRMSTIREARFGMAGASVYRLGAAIPIIVEPPANPPSATSPDDG